MTADHHYGGGNLVPDIYGDAILHTLQRDSALIELFRGTPVVRPTRRQRLARWIAARLPRVHIGPCDHESCDTW